VAADPATTHLATPPDPPTGLIRPPQDAPTGLITPPQDAPTGLIAPAQDPATGYLPRARPQTIPSTTAAGTPTAAIAASVLSILSGWTTAVIATSLISNWGRTDQLFCVAIGFLTIVSGGATICGLVLLLLRKRMGRLLISVGAIIGLLVFASLFIAGARLHPIVYAIPVLPVASIAVALLPATARWARTG
jgi:hypothetical protein